MKKKYLNAALQFIVCSRRGIAMIAVVMFAISAMATDLEWLFTFNRSDVTLSPKGEFTWVSLADGSNPRDAIGAPAIPAKYANILLPDGATDVKVSASGNLVLLASDVTPWPIQLSAPKSKPQPPFTAPDPVAYASADPWPAVAATFEGLHQMQGSTFVSVRVNPLVYVGAEKKLYYRPVVNVTVSYTLPRNAARSGSQGALATEMVNALVVNPTQSSSTISTTASRGGTRDANDKVDYLIITSQSLADDVESDADYAFQKLATYRATPLGGSFSTRIVTIEDITANYEGDDVPMQIRNCITDYYQNHGTTYVVLGGDDSVVPVRYTYAYAEYTHEWHMPTDLYYSDLTGNWQTNNYRDFGLVEANVDMSPEVIVGRIPIRNADQLDAYLAKVQAFEKDLTYTRNSIILGGPAAWCRYYGDKRPTDDVTGDGHRGFLERTSPTDPIAPIDPTDPKDPYYSTCYVSDSEMWIRRLYRDGIKPYWANAESEEGRTVHLATDAITSWDTEDCGDKPLISTNFQSWLNNTGYTHLMFSGHGFPQGWGLEYGDDYAIDEAAVQTNLTPFIYTDACLTCAFDEDGIRSSGITVDVGTDDEWNYNSEPCLGEAFLRNSEGGALVHMGCSRYGWGDPDYLYEDPDTKDKEGMYIACTASNTSDGGPSTVYAYKFYSRLYEGGARDANRTIGQAFAMSKADMISECKDYGRNRWIQFGLNYLGDPAITLYPRTNAAPVIQPLELADNGENEKTIAVKNGGKYNVTLKGRTLYKDGDWNTLYLPFDVEDGDDTDNLTFSGTPLEGADVRELTYAGLEDGELTLNFTPVTTIEAGVPYIIKWEKGQDYVDDDAHNIVNPEFNRVTIIKEYKDPWWKLGNDQYIDFYGTYSNISFEDADRSILFLGAENTLYYPQPDLTGSEPQYPTIGAFRAFFFLTGFEAGDPEAPEAPQAAVRRIKLNFEDEATGIGSVESLELNVESDEWYTLTGVKLEGKPTEKGVYIYRQKKVFIP